MPPIKIKEEWQNIISQIFAEELEFDPAQVERFFVNNLVQRTLAHLVGQGDVKSIPIRATSAGGLIVSPIGTGFEHNETLSDVDVSDNNWHDRVFAQIVSRVDVMVTFFDGKIRRRPRADAAWEGEIKVPKNSFRSFDCSTQGLQIHNVNAGENPVFEIVGWY